MKEVESTPIIYLSIGDDEVYEKPFAALAISTEEIADVNYCYDKTDMIDLIDLYKEEFDERSYDTYLKAIFSSALPENSLEAPVKIDGYSGYKLAEAIAAYNAATDVRFAPGGSWPWIDYVPNVSFTATFAGYDPSCDDDLDFLNVMFTYFDELQNFVYIAHSWEQLHCLIEELDDTPLASQINLRQLTKPAGLPEVSEFPLQRVTGSVADSICIPIRYYQFMTGKLKNYLNSPWREIFQ